MERLYNEGITISKIKNKTSVIDEKHTHHYYELLYVRSGNFDYFIDKSVVHVSAKEVILVDKNNVHKALFTSVKSSYFIIKFEPHFLDDEFKSDVEQLFLNKKISLQSFDYFTFDMLFSKMQHSYEDKKAHFRTLVKYQLSEILLMLLEKCKNQINTDVSPKASLVDQIANYIQTCVFEQKSEVLRLDEIAKKFNVSPCHLSKKFKKETGFGLKEYILSTKIAYAKNLMETSNSIIEIAYKCGFNDSNYFSTVFKKVEKATPRDYIKYIKHINL